MKELCSTLYPFGGLTAGHAVGFAFLLLLAWTVFTWTSYYNSASENEREATALYSFWSLLLLVIAAAVVLMWTKT